MDVDSVEKKLYFQDGNSISRFNLHDEDICVEVIVKSTTAYDMGIDWKEKRIIWTENIEKRIFTVNLNGTGKTVLVKTTETPYCIALDPLEG